MMEGSTFHFTYLIPGIMFLKGVNMKLFIIINLFQMKNKSDNYWVVGLDEKSQQIR